MSRTLYIINTGCVVFGTSRLQHLGSSLGRFWLVDCDWVLTGTCVQAPCVSLEWYSCGFLIGLGDFWGFLDTFTLTRFNARYKSQTHSQLPGMFQAETSLFGYFFKFWPVGTWSLLVFICWSLWISLLSPKNNRLLVFVELWCPKHSLSGLKNHKQAD